MLGHHHIPVPVSISGARELGSLLEGYIGYFLSSGSSFDTVVLVLESFGAGVVERYVSTAQLERALERAAGFDPAVWVYLPLLWDLGLGGARRLMEELDRRTGIYTDRAVEAVKRSVAERRRLRLAAIALASKHLIGIQGVIQHGDDRETSRSLSHTERAGKGKGGLPTLLPSAFSLADVLPIQLYGPEEVGDHPLPQHGVLDVVQELLCHELEVEALLGELSELCESVLRPLAEPRQVVEH